MKADVARCATASLPLGAAGDVLAARAVARALLQGSHQPSADPHGVLAAVVLTALCLHAAQVSQGDVYITDLLDFVRRLACGPDLRGDLRKSPVQFARFAGAELEALPAAGAHAVVETLAEQLARATGEAHQKHQVRKPL